MDWELHEALLGELAALLSAPRGLPLRERDRILDIVVNGNAFVLLLTPPRDGKPLEEEHLAAARVRLEGTIRRLLDRVGVWRGQEQFGCFFGGATIEAAAPGRLDRRLWAALDKALAAALRSRDEAGGGSEILRELIERETLHAVYQPIVDLARRCVLGYEGLSRPEIAALPRPDEMLRRASEQGLLWPVERLCRKRILDGIGSRFPKNRYLFINVDPRSLGDPDFFEGGLLDRLGRAGLRPERTVLEVTEQSEAENLAELASALRSFRALGFQVALDDVGAGFSGLRVLTEIRPDFIKVDLSLVRNIHLSPTRQEMMVMILNYARNTGSRLISEGVESLDELRVLRRIGIRYAQGYLFAQPVRGLVEPDLEGID